MKTICCMVGNIRLREFEAQNQGFPDRQLYMIPVEFMKICRVRTFLNVDDEAKFSWRL